MRRAFGLLILPLLATCAPAIERFNATPNVPCPGDVVTVDWKVNGAQGNSVVLGVDPSGAAEGLPRNPEPAEGSERTILRAPVTFRLHAENASGSVDREIHVAQMQSGDPLLHFGDSATIRCPEVARAIPFVLRAPAGLTSQRVRVVNVQPILAGDAALVDVVGPGRGDRAAGGQWSLVWQYRGLACPDPAGTNAPSKPGPSAIMGLNVDVECGPP